MSKRKGFTFIEVALFLAVTAALFLGIALGMQNAFFRQRYDDSVQNFFEYMRSIYSKVSNPQSPGDGNSTTTAIYGKLIVFGETNGINGEALDPLDGRPIFMYDVVGDVKSSQEMGTGKVTDLLEKLHANVVRIEDKKAILASPEKYEPRWQTDITIRKKDGTFTNEISILVVRHPRSGTINTLILDKAIQVNSEANSADNNGSGDATKSGIAEMLTQYLGEKSYPKFEIEELDFCVNPYGPGESGSIPKQDIRLFKNARNASSVEMIELDGEDNRCN